MNSAFTLNRFEQEGADGVVEFRLEIFYVVEIYEFDAGEQGAKGSRYFSVAVALTAPKVRP